MVSEGVAHICVTLKLMMIKYLPGIDGVVVYDQNNSIFSNIAAPLLSVIIVLNKLPNLYHENTVTRNHAIFQQKLV